jgi:gliding motility-associated-like protein
MESINDNLSLSWNSYKEWSGSVAFYQIFIETGNGYEEKAHLEPSDSTFILDYQQIMYNITGDQVCIYVKATEATNPHGITGTSQSPEVCISPTEVITVPNIFTPNNDLVNDEFRPVLSFTPKDYHLVISDRQGNILFETRDFNLSWDGSQGGSLHSQDVCLWFLKVTTPSGKRITRTGTITILNNR